MSVKRKGVDRHSLQMKIDDLMHTLYMVQSIAQSGMLFRSKEASECIHEIVLIKLLQHGPTQ